MSTARAHPAVADATHDAVAARRRLLAPLALTQFVASFAGSNMNVAINSIAKDLGTTVHGVQTAITLFLLCMAALMIPGSKLTDRWGRKRCLNAGLTVYGTGAVIGAVAPGLGVLILGYSAFEGVGSALMIPPIYILATLYFDDVRSRARAFGAISGMAGIGAAAGPLVGGLITTAISWRASFLLQAAIVAWIVVLARHVKDPLPAAPTRRFDLTGAVLSAGGMLLLILGILQAGNNWALFAALLALGSLVQVCFFLYVRHEQRVGKEPLLSTRLFRSRTANLAMVTQNIQWLLLMGAAFVITVFLQVVRGYSAIRTGVVFTAATAGILLSSMGAERFAQRRDQRTLIIAGFVVTLSGIGLLLGLYKASQSVWALGPGLLLMGLGVGLMLTPSVNVVQSSFPEEEQGEISGLSRSVSNLGSSLGTAIAGAIVVTNANAGNRSYAAAMLVLAGIGLIGLVAAFFIPPQSHPQRH
ncbi:MAG TPA: MFS transporter [Solirubrobacteraceae bacterium]|nr:MFS transporter [Solirubrobacteraceae bacterium]